MLIQKKNKYTILWGKLFKYLNRIFSKIICFAMVMCFRLAK